MASATAFTRVTAARYGFNDLDIVLNRSSTPTAKDIVSTILQTMAQSIDAETNAYILEQWVAAGAQEDGFISFMLGTQSQHREDALPRKHHPLLSTR